MVERNPVPGTFQYTAPEYLLGEGGTPHSDLYSPGVVTYQVLTGKLPYGARMAQARTGTRQRKAPYVSALQGRSRAAGLDRWRAAPRRAVHPDPVKRYEELSEFLFDLRHPNEAFQRTAVPLIGRNPLLFWKARST